MDGLFKLEKLTIYAFDQAKEDGWSAGTGKFEVMFNPASLAMHYGNVYNQDKALGAGSGEARFQHAESKELRVDLVVDGSGVTVDVLDARSAPGRASVEDQVSAFMETCFQKKSSTHEPRYLRLQWGRGVLGRGFDCRLQSVDVRYTSFKRDGSPLRAELAAIFVEHVAPERRQREEAQSSPDLTHHRIIRAGDTLPLLCREIYGSPKHYLFVARHNELDDFRDLEAGQSLIFPPLDHAER